MGEIEEKIVWHKCKKCGKLQYSEHVRCLNCKNREFEEIEAPNEAILLTYTILKAPPKEYRNKESYALGIVEFPNGIRALGQIISEKGLKIGMKLKTEYLEICSDLDGEEVCTFVFEPIS
ncbi:MAG: OB-fold domain-containing protein [Candidatus Helarchaeota archaeon]|nr:OB-fold domain-containing protein [Candidatus Helarchaeota archaeon]